MTARPKGLYARSNSSFVTEAGAKLYTNGDPVAVTAACDGFNAFGCSNVLCALISLDVSTVACTFEIRDPLTAICVS